MEVTRQHSANLSGYRLAVENFRSEMQLESVIHSSSTGFIFTPSSLLAHFPDFLSPCVESDVGRRRTKRDEIRIKQNGDSEARLVLKYT